MLLVLSLMLSMNARPAAAALLMNEWDGTSLSLSATCLDSGEGSFTVTNTSDFDACLRLQCGALESTASRSMKALYNLARASLRPLFLAHLLATRCNLRSNNLMGSLGILLAREIITCGTETSPTNTPVVKPTKTPTHVPDDKPTWTPTNTPTVKPTKTPPPPTLLSIRQPIPQPTRPPAFQPTPPRLLTPGTSPACASPGNAWSPARLSSPSPIPAIRARVTWMVRPTGV